MEAGAVLAGDVGEGVEGVDGAGVGGACGGGEEDGSGASGEVGEAGVDGVGVRMPSGVGRVRGSGRPRSQAERGMLWWALAPQTIWRGRAGRCGSVAVPAGAAASRARSRASWLDSVPPVVISASGSVARG